MVEDPALDSEETRGPHAPAAPRRRSDGLRTWWAPGVLACCALALLALVVATRSWHAATPALALAGLLVVPGEIVLRVLPFTWRLDTLERFGVSVVLSYAVLVSLAGVLAAFGALRPVALAVAGLVFVVAAGACWLRWRPPPLPVAPTVTSVLFLVVVGATTCALASSHPFISDRIFLGQLDISMDVIRSGGVPNGSVAFDHAAPFPVNYAFYSFFLAWAAPLSGGNGFPSWVDLSVALRGVHLGLFGAFWALAGRELLRASGVRKPAVACLAVLPVVLYFNAYVQAKFREPVVEGFAMALGAVTLWAVIRWTRDRRRGEAIIALLSVFVLVGTHLPALVATLLFCLAWLCVAPVPAPVEGAALSHAPYVRWLWQVFLRSLALVAATLLGVIALRLVAGRSAVALADTAIKSGSSNPASILRGLNLMIDMPLSPLSARESLLDRRWNAISLAVTPPFVWVTVGLAVAAVLGVVLSLMRRPLLRGLAWCLVAGALTMGYCGLGMALSGDSLVPWNAVMRNTFYVWFPIACGIVLGLQQLATALARLPIPRWRWLRSSAGPVLGVALLVVTINPVVREKAALVRASGWLTPPGLTADGQSALRWVATYTPPGSNIALSETTYGSRLYAERNIVTEGKATIESPVVVAAANNVIAESIEFFLPARSPQLLRDHDVNYLVVGSDLTAGVGSLAGTPVLRGYPRLPPAKYGTFRPHAPYLHLAFRAGQVRVFKVDRQRLPTFAEREIHAGRRIPPCHKDVCITRVVHDHAVSCPRQRLSSEPNVCLVRDESRSRR